MLIFGSIMFGIGVVVLIVSIVSFFVWLFGTSDSYYNEDSSAGKFGLILLGISIFFGGIGSLILAPWLHPLFFHVFFNNLGFWLVLLVIFVVTALLGALIYKMSKNEAAGKRTFGILFVVGFIAWSGVYGVFAGHWTKTTVYETLAYESLEALPDTSAIRYLPLEVAKRFGESRLQEPALQLGDANPVVTESGVDWLLPRVPKGFWNEWLKHADGFAVVDSAGNVQMVREEMKYGEGMLGSDHIIWKLRQARYWSKVNEIYYVQGPEGEVVAVAPYTDYSFKFPVMVPHWGGVFLVHSNGAIENLSPEEAASHPLLAGVRIFPEKLAKLHVEAYAYKNGLGNALFTHKDQIQIPSVRTPYSANEMPFLLPTKAGQKWFVAAVPWGAEGVYRIFLIDAITGTIELFELDKDSSLFGPNRAREFVTRAYPYFDWDKNVILEPRPIMRTGVLYWMFTITPTTFAGVTDTVLVNASTSEVLSFGQNKTTLVRFLNGEGTGRLLGVGGDSSVGLGEKQPASPAIPTEFPNVPPEDLEEIIEQLELILERLRELEGQKP